MSAGVPSASVPLRCPWREDNSSLDVNPRFGHAMQKPKHATWKNKTTFFPTQSTLFLSLDPAALLTLRHWNAQLRNTRMSKMLSINMASGRRYRVRLNTGGPEQTSLR
jgi:hypothetical protein